MTAIARPWLVVMFVCANAALYVRMKLYRDLYPVSNASYSWVGGLVLLVYLVRIPVTRCSVHSIPFLHSVNARSISMRYRALSVLILSET